MDINFELYKIFYHAAKLESFSEAAKKLFISQSAVSQSIKSLEEKIGSKLFFRKSKNVRLTGEGELLLRHVEQAYNFIKAAENKFLEMQNLELGEIRIGAGDTVCKYFLIPHMEKFSLKYPKIKIRVTNRTSSQILAMLKNGALDLGIVTLPVGDRSLSVREFKAVEDIFVASDRYRELRGKKTSLKQLAGYPLLMLPKSSSTRRNLEDCLHTAGLNVTPEIELESIDLLVEFSKIGLGISHVLRESAEDAILKGELFKVDIKESLPLRKLGIVTMEDVPLSHAAVEFINSLTL